MKPVKLIGGKLDDRHRSKRHCRSFFLDSGAFSLYQKYVQNVGGKFGYSKYDTPEFWRFVDAYAKFVKKYKSGIDHYANLDVLFSPERSWKVLKYLENEHGLNPVPVVHFGAPVKWLEKHLDAGYTYIGIGGRRRGWDKFQYFDWADQMFDAVCGTADRLPKVRTHGFAVTSWSIFTRYPFWSIDSATWARCAAYGGIFVPRMTAGRWDFTREHKIVPFTDDNPARGTHQSHYKTMTKSGREWVHKWLDEVGVPLGTVTGTGLVKTEGVINHYGCRAVANMRYYAMFAESLPKWPWPFLRKPKRTFF